MELIVSCEHAGNKIPNWLKNKVKIPAKILSTHRAYDINALPIAKKIAKSMKLPLFYHEETRLVIDYNRSLHHPKVFSEFSKSISDDERLKLKNKYNLYREKIHGYISKKKQVCHLAIHSFTPELNGQIRNAEIGILYDSRIKKERVLALKMQNFLKTRGYAVRLNYPYQGKSDGLTTSLRKKFKHRYLGFEIEINQSLQNLDEVALDLIGCFKNL